MKAKGLNVDDSVLQMSIANRLIHSLRMQQQRKTIALVGKRHGVSVWKLPPSDLSI